MTPACTFDTPARIVQPQPRRAVRDLRVPVKPLPPTMVTAVESETAHNPDVGDGKTLHRIQLDVGQTGIHPIIIKAVAGLYASMVLVFWITFGRGEATLALGFISLLGAMYFGLLTGGTLVSDTPDAGNGVRSFSQFLNGRVVTYTGWITGREATLQILTLSALLVVTAVVLGVICRLNAH